MSVPASVDENDPFWVVQLSSSDTAETTPFEFGGLRADYEVRVEIVKSAKPDLTYPCCVSVIILIATRGQARGVTYKA